ncbi:hypothetical protein [Lactiplantibacillus daowaiensis]|uniref:Cell surface protein n=1 Tax=Lactiplantibacillus daowaiensis TaxID=2559918 RepID=A0ABW1RZ60_9LACO|nr:hypothetical protein [Lactiplantibacillus daowaiensis]
MNKKQGQLIAMALILTGLSFATIPAQAKTTYSVVKTTKLAKAPYHVTNTKKVTYTWNLAHTQKLQLISGNEDAATYANQTTWYVDKKVTLKHANKTTTYFHITNDNGNDSGYVYHQALAKGYAPKYSATLNDGKYYRLNAATTVTSYNKVLTLPKDTVVRAATNINDLKETFSISLNALSYKLKKQLGISKSMLSATIAAGPKLNWTKISTPAYMLPYTGTDKTEVWGNDLFPGSDESRTNTQRLRITTDGYLEFYNNASYQSMGTVYPIGTPTSRQILTSNVDGNTITVTYHQAIPGLTDTAITVAGKTEYQLTIEIQKQLTDKSGYALAHYVVGGKPFYSWASAFLLPDYDTPNPATALSETNFKKLDKEFFNTDTFYKTTKKVKIKAPFTGYEGGLSQLKTVTLPKGTVVAGNKPYRTKVNRKYVTVFDLRTNILSSRLLKVGYQTGLVAGTYSTEATSTSGFKQVKRPNYMPTYSYGDLYLGSNTAITNRSSQLATQSVQITADGYVEVHKNSAKANSATYYSKPVAAAKIQRVVIKNKTRQLFLNKRLSGLKTTKVKYQGKTQYQLNLTNQHKYRVVEPLGDSDDGPAYYNLYTLAGKTFYTPLGSING